MTAATASMALQSGPAQVLAVIDGDTLLVRQQSFISKVRLAGIDAPELQQPYGPAAKTQLQRLLPSEKITLTVLDIDRYQRPVVHVRLC